MKTDMRRELARQPFEQKIRKVARLIQLAIKLKAGREGGSNSAISSKPNVNTVR